MMTFTKTSDNQFRKYVKPAHVPSDEEILDLDAMKLVEMQSAIAFLTGATCGKLKDKATGRTKLTALLKDLPLTADQTPVPDVPVVTEHTSKTKPKAEQGPKAVRPKKQGPIFEFAGATLSSDELAVKIEACRKLSKQRAAIAIVIQSFAATQNRTTFTSLELREMFRSDEAEAAIPSKANQDRWRLFRWHLPFLTEAGIVREVR